MARFQDRRVLDRADDDVCARVSPCEKDALDGEVVGFASAAREDDVRGCRTDQLRYLYPTLLQQRPGGLAGPVRTRRIAVMVFERGAHRLRHGRIHGRARDVVQVDVIHAAAGAGSVSRMRMATTMPEMRVTVATAVIASDSPSASASTPDSAAPKA